jgi:disulfide bond formation protein DsbB
MSSEALPFPAAPNRERDVALAILALSFATIAGAWIYQALGYLPCDLCLQQRYAYYAGVPLAAVALALAGRAGRWASVLFVVIGLVFAASVALAIYHSGVEMKLWQGPTACTGSAMGGTGGDLLAEIEKVKVVRCDDVGLRVFGLTLANWNVFISLALAGLAGAGARLSWGRLR